MTQKIFRGTVMTFTSEPRDGGGAIISPASVKMYVNYKHSDGTISTDAPTDMDEVTDGTFEAEFNTNVCMPGTLFVSVRSTNPGAAEDLKFNIIANAANPAP